MNTSRNKDKWDSLSMKEKSDMMKAAVQQGIYNLSDIRKAYNEYAEGGPENNGTPRPITTGGAGYIPPAPTSIPFTFNPDRIVQDVPAREWGPTPINFDENGELNIGEQGEGNGGVADSMYYYLLQRGNKLGDKNIEIALNNLKNNPWYFNEKIPDEDISFAFSEKRPVFEKDNISKATTDQKKALAAHYIADSENYLNHAGAMRRYFGKDDLGVLRESAYKPGISKDPNSKYYIFNNMLAPGYWDPVVEDLVQSEEKSKHYYDPTLNEFTASKGHDNTGDYVSIYDIWDYNTNVVGRKNNSSPDNIKHVVNGKPFDIYPRVYLDDYYDVSNNKKGSYFLPEVTVTPDKKSLGGPLVQKANKFYAGGEENQPYTPFLNETPMQAAIRQLQSPEAQAAYWNATHPQTTNETPIVAQPDGTFRREVRNIPLNTSAETAKTTLEFTPVIGDVMFAGDVANEARQGNYGTAAALAGLALLPNVVEKPLKKGLRKLGLFDNVTTATKATPAEWTAAQDAAIARGDKVEAQRLRDLHNEVATKNVSFKDVGYRGIRHDTSESPFYFTASGDTGPAVASTYMREEGTYTPYTKLWSRTKQLEGREKQLDFLRKNNALNTEQEQLLKNAIEDDKRAINEAKEAIKDFSDPLFQKLYISAENPTIVDAQRSWWNSIPMRDANNKKYYITTDKLALENKNKGKDVLVINNVKDSGKVSIHDPNLNPGTDIVVLDPRRAKSADAITYDNNGVRVPLGERDNFNVNDIRYIWPTALLGGTAATSYANQQGLGGPLVQLANRYEEGGPYKPGTIYGRPTEEGLKIVSPEFDALLIGKVAANAAREATGELLNSGIEGTARQRAAITSRRFGREMNKKNDEIKKWSESFVNDVKTGNYTDVPLDLGALTRNVWETGRYIKNTPERYIENTLPRFYRNVFRRTYNNIKPAVPIIFDNSTNEK